MKLLATVVNESVYCLSLSTERNVALNTYSTKHRTTVPTCKSKQKQNSHEILFKFNEGAAKTVLKHV